jgi:Arf-GAP/GTPase/ANK repeat/PH domain-containing protein 1/3
MQSYWSNSLAVRQEIQRFESVHPSIYAIYDLIEAIPDPLIQQQIREHVVCIEGESFLDDSILSVILLSHILVLYSNRKGILQPQGVFLAS